jgi:MscS family membrane protein
MQEKLNTLLKETSFAGNELWRIGAFFGMLLAAMAAARLAAQALTAAAGRLHERKRPVIAAALRAGAGSASFIGFSVGLKLGLAFLVVPPLIAGAASTVASVLLAVSVAYLVYRLVDAVDVWLRGMATRSGSRMDDMLAPLVRKSLRITVVVLAILQVATLVSDKSAASLIAGLSIGGLAVGLAAQETVKNFFGSLVILGDKPFELGDRIVVDGHDGPVECVGFRSTRIRTLDGHLVTIPNGELANKTIQNVERRPHIRRVLNVAITYDTPPEKVGRALEIVKELLNQHEGMHPGFPPRAYFSDYNPSSLNLNVIYWYHPPDYWKYMAYNERFNLALLRRFNEEGIEFAFPTQTVHLAEKAV